MTVQYRVKSALGKVKRKLLSVVSAPKKDDSATSLQHPLMHVMQQELINLNTTHAHELPAGSTRILEIVPTKLNTRLIGNNWLFNHQNNQQSEHGEDGIIAKIFDILKPTNKWVCEFGAHDPENISNTWRLINKEDWSAVLIEADPGYFEKLTKYYADKNDKVICLNQKVSYEGEDRLDISLANTNIPTDLDFMIIDIDGNDYHVWQAIEKYRAKVVMIEFNAAVPNEISFIQARDMNLNQGTSLRAMMELAAVKGYKLIAVTSWNAFFVRDEYFSLFFKEETTIEDMYVYPARHPITMRVFQLYDGRLIFASWNEMMWHRIDIKQHDNQVLPKSYQVFSRELAAQQFIFEKDGTMSSADMANKAYIDAIKQKPGNVLAHYMQNVHSRHGEDGMIEKLMSIVPCDNRYVVEIGAWDGDTFSKSRNILEKHQWEGLLFEGDVVASQKLKQRYATNNRVHVLAGKYALDDFDKSFDSNHLSKVFDLLIINVYGMEYQIWDSIKRYMPKMVAIQFNPTIQNDIKFVQDSDFSVHQGCSLRALCELAQHKGYELVGVTLETALFARREYFHRFTESLGLQHSELDDMFAPVLMRVFQLYDGTIELRGLDRLIWHAMRIDEEKLQVVPKALRKFHQFAEPKTKDYFYRV